MKHLAAVVAVLWSLVLLLVGALAVGYLGFLVTGSPDAVALAAIVLPSAGIATWWSIAWWRHQRSQ